MAEIHFSLKGTYSLSMRIFRVTADCTLSAIGILLGTVLLFSFPQHALSQSQQMESLGSALDKEVLIGSLKWEALALEVEDAQLMEVSDAVKKVKNMSDDELHGRSTSPIVEVINEFKMYCGEIGYFLPGVSSDDSDDSTKEVIRFFRKDDRKGIIISKLFDDSVYNTNVTSHDERIEERIRSCMIPKIKSIHESLNKMDIEYFGISHFYGAEDPSGYGSPSAEMVSVIIPRSVVLDFSEGGITDKKMIEKSEVYVKSSSMTAEYVRTSVDL